MKALRLILCLSIFTILSCSSDDDNGPDTSPVTEPFFAKINGQDFTALTINAALVSENTIAIEGINAENTDIVLGFTGNLTPGTEFKTIFNSDGTNIFTPIYDSDEGGFFATSGTLTIVSHNKTTREISGRFSFAGADPNDSNSNLNFTEGEFSVTYTSL